VNEIDDTRIEEPTDVLGADHEHEHLRVGPAHVRGVDDFETGRTFGHENPGVVEEVGDAAQRLKSVTG
jgi:threonine dehydrogenase-like Zn-dependent dehydrogenase